MGSRNCTVKDIARIVDVSVRAIDRVLHDRGDVSRTNREKVQKTLDKINYHPSMPAIGLITKKRYHIICIIPYYTEHGYWSSVAQGVERIAQELHLFNVGIDHVFYNHTDKASYRKACALPQTEPVDVVLIAPNFQGKTLRLTSYLESKKVSYTFVDFDMEQTRVLCYIDRGSRTSGHIAARILMNRYQERQEITFFLNNQKNNPAEAQIQCRLGGFIRYFTAEHKGPITHDAVLHGEDTASNEKLLNISPAEHPKAALEAVFNSHIYQVADYLQKKEHRLGVLVDHGLLQKNVEHLKSDEVSYPIGQQPELQGHCGVRALCSHIILRRPVATVRYMPIGILMKEDIDFYFEFEQFPKRSKFRLESMTYS